MRTRIRTPPPPTLPRIFGIESESPSEVVSQLEDVDVLIRLPPGAADVTVTTDAAVASRMASPGE
ncbi:hypothetical protein GCM10022252_26470 [Streptosporangium oxazolinicum]|uniref:Uncharacterized protein n=1 Tax=Streptosporangium oxazolinicum TaxID=909287 RepID=A0ABP8AT34_9ACTN